MKKLLITSILLLSGCTANQMAKNYGGTLTIEVPKNEVFLNATWKESEVWFLTKDTVSNVFILHESSQYGILEGKIIFK